MWKIFFSILLTLSWGIASAQTQIDLTIWRNPRDSVGVMRMDDLDVCPHINLTIKNHSRKQSMKKLYNIFRKNWMSISFSYLLFTLQTLFIIIYPKVLGNFIDGLIAKDYSHVLLMLGTFFGVVFFGFISRIYDTIVFSKIWRRFASVETNKQFESGVDTSLINGRLNMMRSVVNFFEHDALSILNSLYMLIGSMYFIFMTDTGLIPFLLVSMLLTITVTYIYSPQISNLTRKNNDLVEVQTETVSKRNIASLNNLLRTIQKLSVDFSNLQAKYYALIQIIAYGTVTLLITYYVVFNQVTVGSVFSTYRYLFDFCGAVSGIPVLIWSFANIRDVIKRLDDGSETES